MHYLHDLLSQLEPSLISTGAVQIAEVAFDEICLLLALDEQVGMSEPRTHAFELLL
jgi:hypothetical protein